MIRINKGDVIITKMTYEETGIVCPIGMIKLNPIIKNGWNIKEAKEIDTLMKYHNLSQEEAEKTYKENLEWLK